MGSVIKRVTKPATGLIGNTGSTFRKGSKESGQSGGLSQEQAEMARRQMALASEQASLTAPLRSKTAGILDQFLTNKQTPGFLDLPQTVTPLAALSLPALQSQQNVMQRQLMAQGNRGGALQQMLAQTSLEGGIQRTGLMQQDALRQEQRDVDRSAIARSLFGGAADMGTGGLALAFQGLGGGMQGLGGAAGNLNVLGGQRIGQNTQFQQGLGQLIGMGAGGMMGKSGGGGAATQMQGQSGMQGFGRF